MNAFGLSLNVPSLVLAPLRTAIGRCQRQDVDLISLVFFWLPLVSVSRGHESPLQFRRNMACTFDWVRSPASCTYLPCDHASLMRICTSYLSIWVRRTAA